MALWDLMPGAVCLLARAARVEGTRCSATMERRRSRVLPERLEFSSFNLTACSEDEPKTQLSNDPERDDANSGIVPFRRRASRAREEDVAMRPSEGGDLQDIFV